MSDATFLARMMSEPDAAPIKINNSQIKMLVEIVIPRFITTLPGLPPGMKCEMIEQTDKSWTLRIERP